MSDRRRIHWLCQIGGVFIGQNETMFFFFYLAESDAKITQNPKKRIAGKHNGSLNRIDHYLKEDRGSRNINKFGLNRTRTANETVSKQKVRKIPKKNLVKDKTARVLIEPVIHQKVRFGKNVGLNNTVRTLNGIFNERKDRKLLNKEFQFEKTTSNMLQYKYKRKKKIKREYLPTDHNNKNFNFNAFRNGSKKSMKTLPDPTSVQRDVTSVHRDVTSVHRDVTSVHRDVTSVQHDVTSVHRDVTSVHEALLTGNKNKKILFENDTARVNTSPSNRRSSLTSVHIRVNEPSDIKGTTIGPDVYAQLPRRMRSIKGSYMSDKMSMINPIEKENFWSTKDPSYHSPITEARSDDLVKQVYELSTRRSQENDMPAFTKILQSQASGNLYNENWSKYQRSKIPKLIKKSHGIIYNKVNLPNSQKLENLQGKNLQRKIFNESRNNTIYDLIKTQNGVINTVQPGEKKVNVAMLNEELDSIKKSSSQSEGSLVEIINLSDTSGHKIRTKNTPPYFTKDNLILDYANHYKGKRRIVVDFTQGVSGARLLVYSSHDANVTKRSEIVQNHILHKQKKKNEKGRKRRMIG